IRLDVRIAHCIGRGRWRGDARGGVVSAPVGEDDGRAGEGRPDAQAQDGGGCKNELLHGRNSLIAAVVRVVGSIANSVPRLRRQRKWWLNRPPISSSLLCSIVRRSHGSLPWWWDSV